jgi:peptidoglycan/xylan/chitin deacetylase (PgdA/CDA1 family)
MHAPVSGAAADGEGESRVILQARVLLFAMTVGVLAGAAEPPLARLDVSPAAAEAPVEAAPDPDSAGAAPKPRSVAPAGSLPWVELDPGDDLPYGRAMPRPTPDLTVSPTYPSRTRAPLVTNGPRSRPAVAITVDDGHSPVAVEAILEVFLERAVNATWFPVGAFAVNQPALWHRIAGLGFEIANHTWSHPDLTQLGASAIEGEIRRGRAAIEQATGRPVAPFLRPPGGAWNEAVLAAAGRRGEAFVVTWDVTSGDTGRGPVGQVVENALSGRAGTILLFHANDRGDKLRTAEALAIVIDAYRARGFELVTLGQLLGVPGPVPFPGPAPDP